MALGAFHYFRGVLKARAIRNTTASVLRNQARLLHSSASLRQNGSFSSVLSFSPTECSSRVARRIPNLRGAAANAVEASLASLWACRSGRRRVVPLAKSTGTTTDSESFLAAFLPCRLRCGIWRPRKLFPHEFLLTIRRSGRRLGTRPSFTPICPDLSRSVDCASDFFHA